jgi:hypothetical protein
MLKIKIAYYITERDKYYGFSNNNHIGNYWIQIKIYLSYLV